MAARRQAPCRRGTDSSGSSDGATTSLGGGDGGAGGTADGSADCPASAKLVYITGIGSKLYSFYPPTFTFTLIGPLSCLGAAMTPTHMTVDRQGTAWVVARNQNTGAAAELYNASTANASCSKVSTWTVQPKNFPDFALTFLGMTTGDTTLYMLGPSDLGTFDTSTGTVTIVGAPSVTSTQGDMTTNEDGTLYFLMDDKSIALYELDPDQRVGHQDHEAQRRGGRRPGARVLGRQLLRLREQHRLPVRPHEADDDDARQGADLGDGRGAVDLRPHGAAAVEIGAAAAVALSPLVAAASDVDSTGMDGAGTPQVIGRYAIYGRIASGGMASVHFGRLLGGAGFSRTVAIKRLHPHLAEDREFRATLIDEARMAARIHHPNVVATLDVVTAEGELLLVMEYVRGESLARLIKIQMVRNRLLPLPITSAIVAGALHGLHAAHEATNDHGEPLGIVHRDVSPQNILVGVDGLARVIDFGVAKAAGRMQTTRAGTIKGKIAYMSPEQLAGREITRAADVYAMGVVLWEALACKRLFAAESEAHLVNKVLAGPSGPPSWHVPDLPSVLDALVMKALAPDPAARFRTAREMAEELVRVAPPAFAADVGAWAERAARESLVKRETQLAEIESSSGMVAVRLSEPTPALPPSVRSANIGARTLDPPSQKPVSVAPGAGSVHDHVPATASQPSSLSMEAPTPGPVARSSSRRMRLLAVGGGAGGLFLVAGMVVAVWAGGSQSAAHGPAVAAVSVTGSSATAPVPQPVAEPWTAVVPEAPVSTPPPPSASSAAMPRPPRPTVATQRAAAPAAPHATTETKPHCNPPYEFDSEGKKTWKRECL